ncbi:thermonuclease family protein [Aliihoeflea sp. PC F10.4]
MHAPKLHDYALTITLFIVLGALAVHFENRSAHEIDGIMRVVDGDTLAMGATRIRLRGMDAPELGQQCTRGGAPYDCGQYARRALVAAIGGEAVTCTARRKDRYGRFVATCYRDNFDLNRMMVEEGWAVASGDYDLAERHARSAGRGIWAGDFESPRDWRARRGMLSEDGGFFDAFVDRLRLLFDRS